MPKATQKKPVKTAAKKVPVKAAAVKPAPTAKPKAAAAGNYFYANGKRKTAVATVRLYLNGKGKLTINERSFENYFPVLTDRDKVLSPLKDLIDSKLVDYVAMDIKAPFGKYSSVVGIVIDEEKIQRSIKLILNSGISHEFRSTLVRDIHTGADIIEMARMIQGADAYYLQRFRQSQKLVDSKFSLKQALPDSILMQLRERCLSYVKKCDMR